jgi:hypothetical protein
MLIDSDAERGERDGRSGCEKTCEAFGTKDVPPRPRRLIPARPRPGSGLHTRSSRFLPKFRHRSAPAVNRILARRRHLRDSLERARAIFHGRALIVYTGGRVGADSEKVLLRREALVAPGCRQDGDVAGLQRQDSALLAAEAGAALAARDGEHFVNSGMIVHIVVDAVEPAIVLPVGIEKVLDERFAVVTLAEIDTAPIDCQRPWRMLGDQTVVLEANRAGPSGTRGIGGLVIAGAPQTGSALSVFLQVLNNRHDRSSQKLRAGSRSKVQDAFQEGSNSKSRDGVTRQCALPRHREPDGQRPDCPPLAGRQSAGRGCQRALVCADPGVIGIHMSLQFRFR